MVLAQWPNEEALPAPPTAILSEASPIQVLSLSLSAIGEPDALLYTWFIGFPAPLRPQYQYTLRFIWLRYVAGSYHVRHHMEYNARSSFFWAYCILEYCR